METQKPNENGTADFRIFKLLDKVRQLLDDISFIYSYQDEETQAQLANHTAQLQMNFQLLQQAHQLGEFGEEDVLKVEAILNTEQALNTIEDEFWPIASPFFN